MRFMRRLLQHHFTDFLLDAQPPEVHRAFQFLLATAMHEGGNPRFGKFELLTVVEIRERMPIVANRYFANPV